MTISKEIELNICFDYQNTNLSLNDLSTKHSVGINSVIRIIKRNNIPKRTFNPPRKNRIHCNENYFEVINTQKKAYHLALMAADGCIAIGNKITKSGPRSNENNRMRLQYSVKSDDIELVENFKKETESDLQIRFVKQFKEEYQKWYEQCYINICRPKMCQDLINLGVGRDKSINLKFHIVDEKFKKSFVLGYFDGNGYWTINSNGQITFGFTGPVKSFIQDCFDYVVKECKLETIVELYEENNCWKFRIGGNEQGFRFFNWLYKDKELFLKRKYNKAYEHFKNIGYII